MELWTVQDERVYDLFLARGLSYHVEYGNTMFEKGADGPLPDPMEEAYRWMARMLAERAGPPPAGAEFPIWAWKRTDGHESGKPDMRRWRTTYVEKVVRLRLEVDEGRVLLSDFTNWHIPLNSGFYGADEREDDGHDAWLASLGLQQHGPDGIWARKYDGDPAAEEARRRTRGSWRRCLIPDLDGSEAAEAEDIQAVFWEIRPEDVVGMERFTTRLHAGALEVQARLDAPR